MNLIYGSYQHDPGDAEVMIECEGIVSELGQMYAIKERWNIHGRLHANTVADVNTAVDNLLRAYSVNGQSISLSGSSHAMNSGATINGTRVVKPPSFPQGSGGENTTYRTYQLAVEGEYPYVGNSVLLSWTESVSTQGDGGPVWGFLECLNGKPQLQTFTQASVVHVKQTGSAVCMGTYWPAPGPLLSGSEHTDRRSILYELPSDLYGKRVTHWSYEFSSNFPISGLPNFGGLKFHLG
jgi:hypothetical protein